MATGKPPPEAFVEVRPGLWVPPRWFGCEPKAAAPLVFLELFGFILHTPVSVGIGTLLSVIWFIVLRLQFERDPFGFEIRRRNLYYLSLRRMRGVALVSSMPRPFNEAPR